MQRAKLIRRLQSYWRLEALNVLLVPAFAAFLVHQAGDRLSWWLLVSMAATSFLLVVGAVAWRMELRSMQGSSAFEHAVLPFLAAAQPVAVALTAMSAIGVALEVRIDGGWSPSAIGVLVMSLLAALEYVNYYHIQLQHFDHAADFARLIRGRGFREAHLARALRRWRARTAARATGS